MSIHHGQLHSAVPAGALVVGGRPVDRFSFFFAFYGLILGLAVAELLSGFASFARQRRVRELEVQTGLLGLLVFIDICATWIDAYDTLRTVTLNFEGLAAPIMVATGFYLAASMVFPRDPEMLERLPDYYAQRHGFIVAMLLMAELFLVVTFWDLYQWTMVHQPARFWLWQVPVEIVVVGAFVGLIAAKSRQANIVLLALLLFLFIVPYWTAGAIPTWIHEHFDRPA
jgi:hypothetical protein